MQRRRFMQTGFAALAATALPEVYNQYTYASRIGKRPSELRIVEIKRQTVKLPFRPAPQRARASSRAWSRALREMLNGCACTCA